MRAMSLYAALWTASLMSQLSYRASFWLEIVGRFGITSLELLAVFILFQHIDALGGWSRAEVVYLYGVASLVLSAAWWRILVWCDEPRAAAGTCHAIFGRAQIAKYIPGNVFSYFARHYLGLRAGISNRGLAWAALLEAVGLIFAACCLALLGIGQLTELTGTTSPVM